MNDYMNDFNDPEMKKSTATMPQKPTPNYFEAPPVKEAVFTSADLLDGGKLEPIRQQSVVAEILLSVVGALVGSIPGFILWVIIGRTGFVAAACGALLAIGVFAGFTFMSKDGSVSEAVGIVTCVAIIALEILLAEKIVWCWTMSDAFVKEKNVIMNENIEYCEAFGFSESEVKEITNEFIEEEFGFSDGSFSDFFNNFSKTLSNLGMKGKYYKNLLECYIFAAVGAFSIFSYNTKNSKRLSI